MIVQNMAAICPYRVGDYLHTENPTHPATSWPGTSWVQVQGRMLMGASDTYPVGSEGGEAEHTLTRDELPQYAYCYVYGAPTDAKPNKIAYLNTTSGRDIGFGRAKLGNGSAHNNMPPYRATYIWRRTA